MLFSRVVVRLFVLAKYDSLANEIERVKTAEEVRMGSVFRWKNPVCLKPVLDSLTNPLTRMRALQLK
jgi:hypothetical protein